ncbi:HET domain protein [Akanthomyces lecanii RCEF 1005]|uniref:HET domain protein n=1 Tax=Akanthomyces lecanii RCEF 1005 TaxID=1081108 RepID=A0A162K1S8_CORDF|nr:HET domain protein [Akanthomyces lecanii RCEF 1005]
MDHLLLPQDPTFPTPETPYLSSEDWDFGPFRTYLDRKYGDLGLSESPQLPTGNGLLTLPLQRIFDAIPSAKLQSFVQTWLYFGLLAEFLSLNELEDGSRLVSLDQAKDEMAVLYREFSKEGDNRKLLTSVPVLDKSDLFAERVRLAGELAPRFHHLHGCLTRSVLIINNCFHQLDFSIRYSMAGLGELFMTTLYASSHFVTPKIVLPSAGFNWFRDYLKAGGNVEKQMLGVGWCPSEIEKLRNLFQGVSSLHYVTRLRPRTEPGDHVDCTDYACRAFQIDIAKYKPRHVTQGCQCDDVQVDESELIQILRRTKSYPVLKIDTGTTDGAETVNITMETYEPGMNRKLGSWSNEERQAYDEKQPCPLFNCIKSNNAALILKDFDAGAEVMVGILGKAQECVDDDGEQKAVLFERERTVMCWRLGQRDLALLNKVIAISNRLADDPVTANLLACGEEASPERDECLAEVKKWLQTTVAQEWENDPDFAQLVGDIMGGDMEGSVWPLIVVEYSNIIYMKDSAEDQVWFVD